MVRCDFINRLKGKNVNCKVACVASVSAGLSTGLSVLRSHQFLCRQKAKNHLERAKKPTGTLATQANWKEIFTFMILYLNYKYTADLIFVSRNEMI